MTLLARQYILEKLKRAPNVQTKPRSFLALFPILSFSSEERVAWFSENLAELTGVVYRLKDAREVKAKLAEIAIQEKLKTVMVSTDDVIAPLNLSDWGKQNDVETVTASDFADHENYREAVFNQVQAGITGADFAVAESGTLCLNHGKDQPRLISIAPILHIAVLPIERLFSVYEQVMDRVFADKNKLPDHVTLITGPSMTADIQGGQFKGMHGPGKLIVILVG